MHSLFAGRASDGHDPGHSVAFVHRVCDSSRRSRVRLTGTVSETVRMPDSPKPTEAAEPHVDLTGRSIGDFAVLRKIGQGGMGQVYLARQQSLKREVALKILRKDLAENAVALKRFQAEAEAVAKISHPNIVQVYAVGVQEGLHFMALEYVEGRDLREYLERKGPPELPVALLILRQVGAALQRAGELGLVHRDIKPENILLNRKVEVKVTDFGLSCYFAGDARPVSLTQSGMTLGTPLYMSPEQVQGKPVDHRSDLYSFGVTSYHVLAGNPPYAGLNAFDVAVQHVQATPEPLDQIRPDLPAELCALVMKLMAKRPEDRYQSAKEVLRDLGRVQKNLALGAPAPLSLNVSLSGNQLGGVHISNSVPLLAVQPTGANRWPWRLIGSAVLAAAGFGGWWAFEQSHPEPAPVAVDSVVGLPETRPPSAVISPRQIELRETFKRRPITPITMRAGMELGLNFVREHRFDDGDAVFAEFESFKPAGTGRPLEGPNLLLAVGKFGKGIVLAHRDRAADSNKLFEEAVATVKPLSNRHVIERFFFDHSEFGMAISEALNRNAENLPANQKMPPALDWMRTPAGLLRIKGTK